MKLILFLGSGVSLETGLPCTAEITKNLLYDEWHSFSDSSFYHGPHPDQGLRPDPLVPRLQTFLRILKEYAENYYSTRRTSKVNYEDLYHLAQQIYEEEIQEIDNPAIAPFASEIRSKTQSLCGPIRTAGGQLDIVELAKSSCDLIQCVVWGSLHTDSPPKGLELIVEIARWKDIEKLYIVTLNHDLLVERLLTDSKIQFVNGFDDADGDVRFFVPRLYSNSLIKTHLIKLHGSIDWYQLFTRGDNWKKGVYGIPINSKPLHCKTSRGVFSSLGHRPIFLCGTYNKLVDYGYGIYAQLHNFFYQLLPDIDKIVISGYGWNDRGINDRIFEWLYSDTNKRLILLHQRPDKIKRESKSGMWHLYDDLVKEDRLIPIQKWLNETTLNELLASIK